MYNLLMQVSCREPVNILVFYFQINNLTGRLKFIIVEETIITLLLNDIKDFSDRFAFRL